MTIKAMLFVALSDLEDLSIAFDAQADPLGSLVRLFAVANEASPRVGRTFLNQNSKGKHWTNADIERLIEGDPSFWTKVEEFEERVAAARRASQVLPPGRPGFSEPAAGSLSASAEGEEFEPISTVGFEDWNRSRR